MKPFTFLSSFRCVALYFIGITATPVKERMQINRRASVPDIQCWSEPNFTGNSVNYTSPQISFDECYDITADFPPYTDAGLSSVKAGHDNFCILYPNTICDPGNDTESERLWVIGSYYDLGNSEVGFADILQSFKCSLCTSCGN